MPDARAGADAAERASVIRPPACPKKVLQRRTWEVSPSHSPTAPPIKTALAGDNRPRANPFTAAMASRSRVKTRAGPPPVNRSASSNAGRARALDHGPHRGKVAVGKVRVGVTPARAAAGL